MLWKKTLTLLMPALLALGISASVVAMGTPQIQYFSHEEFLAQAFVGNKPDWKMLRLNPALKKQVESILQHPYAGMRLRYWVAGERTAWIIDEIGKDMPITIGVVAEGDALQQVKILVYREERGGEVHQDFFTRQFQQIKLNENNGLSRDIDGITGATLSVDAVSRVANLVLVMHRQVTGQATH